MNWISYALYELQYNRTCAQCDAYLREYTNANKHTITTRWNEVVITVSISKWIKSRIGDNNGHRVYESLFRSGGCNFRVLFLFRREMMSVHIEWHTRQRDGIYLSVSNQCGTPTDGGASMVESPMVFYCTSEMRLLQSFDSNRIRIVRRFFSR